MPVRQLFCAQSAHGLGEIARLRLGPGREALRQPRFNPSVAQHGTAAAMQPQAQRQHQIGAEASAKARVAIGKGAVLRRPPGALPGSKIEHLERFHHLLKALAVGANVLDWSRADRSWDRAKVFQAPKPFLTSRTHQRIEGQPPKYLDASMALKAGR